MAFKEPFASFPVCVCMCFMCMVFIILKPKRRKTVDPGFFLVKAFEVTQWPKVNDGAILMVF